MKALCRRGVAWLCVVGVACGTGGRGLDRATAREPADLVGADPFAGVGNAPARAPTLDLNYAADLDWAQLELDGLMDDDPRRAALRSTLITFYVARGDAARAAGDERAAWAWLRLVAACWRADELAAPPVAGLAPVMDLAEAVAAQALARQDDEVATVAVAVLVAAAPARAVPREAAYRAMFSDPVFVGLGDVDAALAAFNRVALFPSPWMLAEVQRRWDPARSMPAPTGVAAPAPWDAPAAGATRPPDWDALAATVMGALMDHAWLRGYEVCRRLPRPIPRDAEFGAGPMCAAIVAQTATLLARRDQLGAAGARLDEAREYAAKAAGFPAVVDAAATIAMAYYSLGDRGATATWLARAREGAPNGGRVRAVAGVVASWRGDYGAAADLLDLAAQPEADLGWLADLREHQVRALQLAGDAPQARAVAMAMPPDAAPAARARLAALAGDLDGVGVLQPQLTTSGDLLQLIEPLVEVGALTRARALWVQARPSMTAAEVSRWVYATILLAAVDRAHQREIEPAMLTVLRAGDGGPWLALLARFVAGDVPYAEAFAASADRGQRAEVLFYEALLAHGRGEPAVAEQLLTAVVAGGPPTFDEFHLARRWLATGLPR